MGSVLKEVVLTKDFANRKVGEVLQVDGLLATNLIKRKLVKITNNKKKKNEKDN